MGFKWIRNSPSREARVFTARDFQEIGEIMIPLYPIYGTFFYVEENESALVKFPLMVLNLEVQYRNKQLFTNSIEIYKPLSHSRFDYQVGVPTRFKKIPIPKGLSEAKYRKSWEFVRQDSAKDSEVINLLPLKRLAKELIGFDVLVKQFPNVEESSRIKTDKKGKVVLPYPKQFTGKMTRTYALTEVEPLFTRKGVEWFRRVLSSEPDRLQNQVNFSLGKIHFGSKPSCEFLSELVQEALDSGVSVHSYLMAELEVSRPTIERMLKECRESRDCPKNINALKNPKGGRPAKVVRK